MPVSVATPLATPIDCQPSHPAHGCPDVFLTAHYPTAAAAGNATERLGRLFDTRVALPPAVVERGLAAGVLRQDRTVAATLAGLRAQAARLAAGAAGGGGCVAAQGGGGGGEKGGDEKGGGRGPTPVATAEQEAALWYLSVHA